jgi:hypothetical protein
MPQPFHFGLETVFFAGQEMAVDAFRLCTVLTFTGVVFVVFPGGEWLIHCVAGTAAKLRSRCVGFLTEPPPYQDEENDYEANGC